MWGFSCRTPSPDSRQTYAYNAGIAGGYRLLRLSIPSCFHPVSGKRFKQNILLTFRSPPINRVAFGVVKHKPASVTFNTTPKNQVKTLLGILSHKKETVATTLYFGCNLQKQSPVSLVKVYGVIGFGQVLRAPLLHD